jgi:membrane-bound lytic murein transglycosylase MltF
MNIKGVFLPWILMALLLWRVPALAAEEYRPSVRDMMEAIASREGVDPALVEAIIRVESDFNPRAVSPKGAMGLMQLMPGTAALYGVSNPFDPQENLAGGIRYIRDLLRYFGGDLPRALAAYNAGETAVLAYGGLPPYRETREYVKKVLARYHPGRVPPSSSGTFSIERQEVAQRFPEVRREDASSASNEIDSTTAARLRSALPFRPLIEMSRAPLVQTRRAPIIWLQSGAPSRWP